jgi:hypothetical protein
MAAYLALAYAAFISLNHQSVSATSSWSFYRTRKRCAKGPLLDSTTSTAR